MNVYAQVMILYTSYFLVNKLGRSLLYTKYLLTFPYYLYTLPGKTHESPINTIKLEELKFEDTETLIVTKRPDFFSIDFSMKKDDDGFENITIQPKEKIKIEKDVKNLDSYYVLPFGKVVVDSYYFSIFELKIIYDNVFFFIEFKEFMNIIKNHKIIIVNSKTMEISRFVQ